MNDALRAAVEKLAAAGIKNPLPEAQILMARAMNCPRIRVISHPERGLTPRERSTFEEMVSRRASRWPLAYITGTREFYGLELCIGPGVLVPRQETEILVEECVRRVPRDALIADIGAGSGAVAIAVAVSLPEARVFATEVSEEARQVMMANLQKHSMQDRVTLVSGDLCAPLVGLGIQFDAIVSNPPYIPTADIDRLQPEVRCFEPRIALDGGPDGLDVIRRLMPNALGLLRGRGFVAVEVGAGQAEAVCAIASAAGFGRCETARDLAGIDRIVVAYR